MMDKFDAIEYLNRSKYFFGIENYEEALNYVNKGLEVDKINIETVLKEYFGCKKRFFARRRYLCSWKLGFN